MSPCDAKAKSQIPISTAYAGIFALLKKLAMHTISIGCEHKKSRVAKTGKELHTGFPSSKGLYQSKQLDLLGRWQNFQPTQLTCQAKYNSCLPEWLSQCNHPGPHMNDTEDLRIDLPKAHHNVYDWAELSEDV